MIGRDDLMGYLSKLDAKLTTKITLVAVGGTAMTLLGLKEATKDVDFCVETKKDQGTIEQVNKKVKSEFHLDLFKEGYIFSVQLPEDYIGMSKPYNASLKNIELRTLHPLDIIISKAARLNERDIEDIRALIKAKRIDKKRLVERYEMAREAYPASESNFDYNFGYVLKNFF
jgi:hypothetical protein